MSDFEELPALISVPKAAQVLGLSRASAYRFAASGDLPDATTRWSRLRGDSPTRVLVRGRRRSRMSRGRRQIPGITVYPENGKWADRVASEPDPLTGKRVRPYVGGFRTEQTALRQAIQEKRILDAGRSPHPEKIRVREYFQEWLKAIEPNLKETAAQSYRDIIDTYIEPILGQRWLRDLKVTTINSFYRHLSDGGCWKGDGNERMYQVWLQHRDARGDEQSA